MYSNSLTSYVPEQIGKKISSHHHSTVLAQIGVVPRAGLHVSATASPSSPVSDSPHLRGEIQNTPKSLSTLSQVMATR